MSRADGNAVVGVDAKGVVGQISIFGKSVIEGQATTTEKFSGNISSTATSQTMGSVKVLDALGGEHMLTATLTNNSAVSQDSWTVELLDGTTSVGVGQIAFIDGRPAPNAAAVNVVYSPVGVPPIPLVLDFSSNVTSFASGNLSTLAFSSQDGYGPANLTGANFDDLGVLILSYANGQSIKGAKLSLARFDTLDAVEAVGSNSFSAVDSLAWHSGVAGNTGFGKVHSGMVELSNVDLSQEFSDLVIMQRGYQASSQIISTANEMLQELFNMKNK